MKNLDSKKSLAGRFIFHISWLFLLFGPLLVFVSRSMIQARLLDSSIPAETKMNEVLWVHMGAIMVLIPIGIIVSLILLKKLTRPLSEMTRVIQGAASGDFSQQVPDQPIDELRMLGTGLNQIIENQKKMIGRFRLLSGEVVTASYQIQASAEKVQVSASGQSGLTEKTAVSTRQSLQSLQSISEGVKVLLSASDATSSSILEMGASIGEISSQAGILSTAVETTSSSIIEMTSAIKEVKENVERLSQTAYETGDSVNQINASVKKVEETAKEAAQISEQVSLDAHELGVRAIVKTIDGMKKIKETVEKSSNVIHGLGKSSEDIGKILTVIKEVTKQTNLLALNAAILAAQAGEQGKGFAVVAEEIKKLADRTVSSTNEISKVINEVQKETQDAVISIKAGYESVEEGMRLSLAAGDAVGKILESSKNSAELARKIMDATAEQVKGIDQIKNSVEKISSMSREIVRATTEQTKGGEQILSASIKMREISKKLSVSTEEQLQGTRLISQAAENVNTKVQEIGREVDRQKTTGELVESSISEIQTGIGLNSKTADEMSETVKNLINHADLFNAEINKVKVA
jgi:methyl-accepting chemotaxis protein